MLMYSQAQGTPSLGELAAAGIDEEAIACSVPPAEDVADSVRCRQMYSRTDVLTYYRGYVVLEKPEQTILSLLAPQLPHMSVFEIGVGGGRMTEHFAPLAGSFEGIDLCPEMVAACQRRFAGRLPAHSFSVGDMRALASYGTGRYGLVMIGYNTIDHLEHAERGRFLREMRRITRKDGYFCFSSHNIASLARPDEIRLADWRNPVRGWRKWRERNRMLNLNARTLAKHASADHVIIHNGTHGDFSLEIYYVRPSAQRRALLAAGFSQVRAFSLDTGAELRSEALPSVCDRWLYYLCR